MDKKVLVIYPSSKIHHDSSFYLLDPDTGEVLASHLCSGSIWAKSDLHDGRPERLEKWKKTFGIETEAKFIDETDYNWEEIYAKNQALNPETSSEESED